MLVRNPSVPVTCLLLATTFGVGLQSQDASGSIMVTVQQQGADVVIEYSGSWDYWNSQGTNSALNNKAVTSKGLLNTFGTGVHFMATGLTLVSGSWTDMLTYADSGTGDPLGWNHVETFAPLGYTAGDTLTGSLTFNNKTLAGMGFTAGDSGSLTGGAGTVNFTVGASSPAVPGPGVAGLATIGLAGVARRRRR